MVFWRSLTATPSNQGGLSLDNPPAPRGYPPVAGGKTLYVRREGCFLPFFSVLHTEGHSGGTSLKGRPPLPPLEGLFDLNVGGKRSCFPSLPP